MSNANYYRFFGLSNNFSWNELEDAYSSKINSLNGLNISDVDRAIYGEQVQRQYREAKRELTHRERVEGQNYGFSGMLWNGFDYFDRLERRMNRQFARLYNRLGSNMEPTTEGQQHSQFYREVSQPDGSTVVVEETTDTTGNGQVNRRRNSYRRFPDGRQEPVEFGEASRLVGSLSTDNRAYLQN